MDGLTMPDFIDRAKLEALADDEYPVEHSGFTAPPPERCGCDECYVRSMERLAFLAGVAAYAALLDAETTEEWGVAYRQNDGKLFIDEAVNYDDAVSLVANSRVYDMVVQRRVTAYAPVGAALTPDAAALEAARKASRA